MAELSNEQFKSRVYWLLGILALLCLLFMAREALVVCFTAFIFASALLPMVEWLDVRMPRWLAVLLPYILLFVIGTVLVMPIAGMAWGQLQSFTGDLPGYLDQIKLWAGKWSVYSQRYPFLAGITPNRLLMHLSDQNGVVFTGFTGITMTLSQVGIDILSALVISIFLLIDRERIEQYVLRFRPGRDHDDLKRILDNLIRSTGAFVTGQLLFMISFGTLITLGLMGMGLPFPILLGSIAGVLTIIPILGPNIAMIPAILLALLSGGWISAVWVFVLFIVVQIIENNIVGPLIMARAVGLHPLAILLAILFGGMLFGMVGIVLAIPVAACMNIILEEWFMHPEHRKDRLIRDPGEILPEG